jgi:hypothetical protein
MTEANGEKESYFFKDESELEILRAYSDENGYYKCLALDLIAKYEEE